MSKEGNFYWEFLLYEKCTLPSIENNILEKIEKIVENSFTMAFTCFVKSLPNLNVDSVTFTK